MKNRYLSCVWNTSLTEWYKRWFYIREEPGCATFCDIGYILEKRVSWTDRLEYTGQVSELMSLINWSRLDRLGVVVNFLARRVMPCQRSVHLTSEYAGSQDPTRMHQDSLEKSDIQRRMNELFNLADNNFIRSDDRIHAFMLG